MKNQLLKHIVVALSIVLLEFSFSACDEIDDEPQEPKTKTIAVTGVTLNKTTTSILVDGIETMTAIISPKNATNDTVLWTSNDETIATVDNDGKVTGVKKGTTLIIVTTADGNKTDTCTVNVALAQDNISMGGFNDVEW